MAEGLTILKAGHKYLLGIPPTVGVRQFKVDRKIVKKFGTFMPVPFTIPDSFIEIHKKGKIKLRHKRHYNTIFLSGNRLGKADIIVAFSIPEKASYEVIDKRLTIVSPKGKKIPVVVLGDLTEPVDLPSIVNVVRA